MSAKHIIPVVLSIVVLAIACAAAPTRRGSAPHRVGASLDSGASDGGPVVWLPTAPVTLPLGDPPVTQFTATRIDVDPSTCNMTVVINDGLRQRVIVGAQAGPAVCAALISQAKTQVAAQLNVTLQ